MVSSQRFACGLVCSLLLAGVACADKQSKSASDKPIVKVERIVARDGYVVIDGSYLPPPYTIEKRGPKVFISGQFVPTKGLFATARPANPEGRFGNPIARKQTRRPKMRMHTRIRDKLEEGVMLVVWGQESAFLDDFDTASTLDILLTESSPAQRLKLLADRTPLHWVTDDQWTQMAGRFQPTDELSERASRLIGYFREDLDTAAGHELHSPWGQVLTSNSFTYGVTITAMMLAVIATGNLLNIRPEGQGRWAEFNDSLANRQMVTRNVVLIGVLSTVDLLLTMAAHYSGTMMELNPLGARLLSTPASLALFKLSTLAVVCLILFSLRRRRGAQVASWWMCMVCTILTFRWVTFNSLFIS